MPNLICRFTAALRRVTPQVMAVLILGAMVSPAALAAQSSTMVSGDSVVMSTTAPVPGMTAPLATVSGETLQPTARGPRFAPSALTNANASTTRPSLPPADDNVNMGPNLALMGAGAAAVVVGLLIGGDGGTAIALGGGVVGLIGLYRYLR